MLVYIQFSFGVVFAWYSCSLMTEHSYKTSALPDVDPTKHRNKQEVARLTDFMVFNAALTLWY